MKASGALSSSSCSSLGDNTPIMTSKVSSEAGGSSTTTPPRVDRGGSQPWKYYTCPKKCGFHSRNRESHLKNCGSAPTKRVEINLHAPRADEAFAPPMSDGSVAAETRLEPIKIIICPKSGCKSSLKACMEIHSYKCVTQLKREVVAVPEKVSSKQKKQLKPTNSTPMQTLVLIGNQFLSDFLVIY